MSLKALVLAAVQAESAQISPWLVGGITLVILVACILALLAFGAGREHS